MTISPLLLANYKMTFVCLGIAKLGMSNNIGYFFSLSNMLMHDKFKRKICKGKSKAKR